MAIFPLFSAWTPGPADGTDEPVIVSVTDFAVAHARHVPGAAASGLRLRLGWYAMPGAVGLWLWSLPLARRSGSVSVWTDAESLRRFVALPRHAEIVRRYRSRATVRSDEWSAPVLSRGEIRARAVTWIAQAAS